MPRERRQQPYDVVTPTERERREDDVRVSLRRYLLIMVPCLVMVTFGFLAPAPLGLRLGVLAVAMVMPPVAAVVANARFVSRR